MFVHIGLIAGLTIFTTASSISKDPHNLAFKNYAEELADYEETFERNSEQYADCSCKNGVCVKKGNKYECTCPTGWGKYQSSECRECDCGKGINCTFDPGFWTDDKYCICPDGKTLKNERCKDNCVKDPCKNGGTCQNVKEGYTCNCPEGYLGKNCENRDNCVKDPCKNGGTCQNGKEGYTCNCPEGYLGKNCENGDPCLNHKCQNDGVCKSDGRSYTCECKDPYWGDKCEYECDCINGECHKNSEGHQRCVCFPGFGKYSEHECRACNCGKGFNCTIDVGFFNEDKYCLCPGGVQVKNDKCKDFCEHSPCKHGGTCENIANDYKCSCPKDFYGKDCECSCKNGECQNTTNGHYECVCRPEYGLYSEKECRACDCGKGINCTFETSILFDDNKYCLCPGGVKLKNKACEEDVFEFCYEQPCLNGGTCQNETDGYSCICSKGYSGRNCELPDSCENGGIYLCRLKGMKCYETLGVPGYDCNTCIENYMPKRDGSDACEPVTCNNGGKDFCGQKGRNCTHYLAMAGYKCTECLENFKPSDDGEDCELRPCSKDEEIACESQGMSCKRQTFGGIMCDACLPGFKRHIELDVCVQESCLTVGEQFCSVKGKSCVDKENAGYVCGECLEKFLKKDGSDICERKTCENFGHAICASKGMKCANDYDGSYGCDSCLEDYKKRAYGNGCEPVTCENRGKEDCKSKSMTCLNREKAGYVCNDCLPNFIRKQGEEGCMPDETCDERGHKECRSVSKKCAKRIFNDYECGDCLNGHIKDVDGKCVFASCEYIGNYMCSRMLRKCVDNPELGYKCGNCLNDSYTEDYDTKTCIKATCENIGGFRCSSLKRECVNGYNGYQCGECKKGFLEFEGRKECVKECSCENADCKYDDKMEPYCSCFRGFGLWTSNVCKACNCGKGVGCVFGIRNRVLNKYCECPDGNRVIDGPCKVTCKNIGYEFCGEMNRVCSENTTEGYDCVDCKEGYVEDTDTKKCVIATCANKGNEECGNLKRTCYNDSRSSYKCGGCLDGFLPVEDSDICAKDLCMSSPCKNSGICKVINDSFECFCHHPFFGETCEQEIVPTTMLPSTFANYTLPDDITNSTVNDEYSTESSNFTTDFNQTNSKIETTKTTVGYTTTVDFNATASYPTTSVGTTTTTTPKITTKSDSKLKFIFRNFYSVRNLTEVIVKT